MQVTIIPSPDPKGLGKRIIYLYVRRPSTLSQFFSGVKTFTLIAQQIEEHIHLHKTFPSLFTYKYSILELFSSHLLEIHFLYIFVFY